MKFLLLLGTAVSFAGFLQAQTYSPLPGHTQAELQSAVESASNAPVTTSAPAATTSSTNGNSILSDLGKLGSDAWSALSTLDFADGIKTTPFALVHYASGSKMDFGGGMAISTASTNGVNYGFAVAAIHDSSQKGGVDFYDTTLTVSYGKTVNAFGRIPVYIYGETGPCTDLANPTVLYEQSFSGAEIYLGSSGRFSIGAAVGENSKWSTDPLFLFHLSYKW